MSIRRAGMVASLILMLFLLTGGYYVQVSKLKNSHVAVSPASDSLKCTIFGGSDSLINTL